jgi:uncharacterized membrane protein
MSQNRFSEIDVMRGVALVLMLVYHLVYDLVYFDYLNIDIDGFFWQMIARMSLILFLIIVGVGMSLKAQREDERDRAIFTWKSFKPFLNRAGVIMMAAMVVTGVSAAVLGGDFVRFGVLHMIALSLVIFYPLRHLRTTNFWLGLGFIMFGAVVSPIKVSSGWFLPLGIMPVNYASVDYVPLFPWGAMVLWGIGIGNVLYHNGVRQFKLPGLLLKPWVQRLGLSGRQTLIIYLVHQPVIWGTLALVSRWF